MDRLNTLDALRAAAAAAAAHRAAQLARPAADDELGPARPKEVRVVLRNCGQIDPESIEDYLAVEGYRALGQVLDTLTPQQVLDVVAASGLRGRGGAGFPAA